MFKAGENMKLKNIFELKQSNGGIYPRIVQLHGGNSPQYSDHKYRIIAKEGYSENWIMFRCIQEIIKAAVQLEWDVCSLNKDGEKVSIPNHPVKKILDKPNAAYGRSEFIKRAIAFYYLGGDAPIVRIQVGNETKELYTHRPDRVSVELTGKVDQPYANIQYEGFTIQDIKPGNFTLWKNFNPLDNFDGLGRGMPVTKPILKNADLLNAIMDWNVSLMQNGGQVSGVVSLPPDSDITGDQFNRNKAELKNQYSGTQNVGKWMLLYGGATASQMGTNPKDMDWVNGKESVMKDICMGLNVDPLLIGFAQSATYNNKNEAEKGLYLKTAIPLMKELADLLGPFIGVGENEFLDVDYSKIPVLQENIKDLNERLNNSEMSINEKRVARGLEKVKGGDVIAPSGSYAIIDGTVYLPANLIPADSNTSDNPSNSNNIDNTEENKSFTY